MANSNDLRIETPDDIPDMDFWIKIDRDGMRAGFMPKNSVEGKVVILCLALGIRGMVCLLADKMKMSYEDIWAGLYHGMRCAREDFDNDDFEEEGGDDEFTTDNLNLN